MKWVIPLLIVAAICAFFIRSLKTSRQSSDATARNSNPSGTAPQTGVSVETNPDAPVPFGYKCIWFAVKTTNSEDVLATIGLKAVEKCNWKSGIRAAYNGQVFVSPPVHGWTLVAGQDLPTLDDPERAKQTENLLTKLSVKFTEAHQYATHRVVEYHSWVRAANGKIVREYAYLGERGEVLRNMGEKTEGEKAAGMGDGPGYMPNEEDVMKVAEKWSLNPTKLNQENTELSIGWVGRL